MASFDSAYFNIGYLDRLAYQDTVIHRLDPRTKLISTIAFVVMVVSFPKYEVIRLAPLFLFPALMLTLGDIPFRFIAKKVIIVSAFALFVGIFNPLFDRHTFTIMEGVQVSAGWLSLLSILIKFLLTISSALLLVATTSFPGVCRAMRKLGMPAVFTSQLIFLYRYLFVLMEETMRLVRARDIRSFDGKGTGMKTFIRLIGTLFIRTVERAERVHIAMLCRGFQGEFIPFRQQTLQRIDIVFLALTILFLYICRMHDPVHLVGRFVQGVLIRS